MPYALLPLVAKDVRQWLTADVRRETPWPARGAKLLRFLEANTIADQPSEDRADWPAPVPLVILPDVPAFPAESLPK